MFSYDNFKNKIKNISSEKIENVIYTSWYGNTIKILLIVFIIIEILFIELSKRNMTLYIILYMIILITSIIYMSTRKSGLALTKNNVLCVIFNHFGLNPKKIYEIPKTKIKSINHRKLFYFRFINISFIDETGRLKTLKLFFSSFTTGSHSKEFKENSDAIYNYFCNQQKIMEKGDF